MNRSRWNGAKERLDERREWIRQSMPSGPDGFVAEDLDLVVRTYGPMFHTDAKGVFMLVELKIGGAPLGASKVRTFGLLHEILRQGDPYRERYRGFFVVRTSSERWSDSTTFDVNGIALTADEFKRWLSGEEFAIRGMWESSFVTAGSWA